MTYFINIFDCSNGFSGIGANSSGYFFNNRFIEN